MRKNRLVEKKVSKFFDNTEDFLETVRPGAGLYVLSSKCVGAVHIFHFDANVIYYAIINTTHKIRTLKPVRCS